MFKYLCTLVFICLTSKINAQNFINSSIARMNGKANSSLAIQFKSIDKCIDIQNGVAVLNGERINGIFYINCKEEHTFNKLGLKFYPNPVYNMAKLQILHPPLNNEEFTISAWSTLGIKTFLKKETVENLYRGITINMSSLSAGPYVLVVESNKFLDAIKFIKKD